MLTPGCSGQSAQTHHITCLLSPPRIIDQRFEKVSYFVFGDFNFRLDSKSVVEVGPQPRLIWSPRIFSSVERQRRHAVLSGHVQRCHSHWACLRQKVPIKKHLPVSKGAVLGVRCVRPLGFYRHRHSADPLTFQVDSGQKYQGSSSEGQLSAAVSLLSFLLTRLHSGQAVSFNRLSLQHWGLGGHECLVDIHAGPGGIPVAPGSVSSLRNSAGGNRQPSSQCMVARLEGWAWHSPAAS